MRFKPADDVCLVGIEFAAAFPVISSNEAFAGQPLGHGTRLKTDAGSDLCRCEFQDMEVVVDASVLFEGDHERRRSWAEKSGSRSAMCLGPPGRVRGGSRERTW